MLEELGVVKDLRDEGDGSGVTHVGGFGGAGTAGQDPTGVAEDVSDASPESPLVENASECLSVGMTSHSLDSWYWPVK